MNSDTNTNSLNPTFQFDRFLLQNNPSRVSPSSSFNPITSSTHIQNPRKKRSKMIRIESVSSSSGSHVSKPKHYSSKKPDPSAPKITRPCSECGKKFWSWKALFGHMRCHPERQWRGINPPNTFRRPFPLSPINNPNSDSDHALMTEEDQDIADCLIMLSNSCPNDQLDVGTGSDSSCRFECSSCKKVFGSHQALGGHRASHKNVKGCFAITKSDEEIENFQNHCVVDLHKCSKCPKVFSSGQALGGHKRCHWERVNLDLNLPAPIEDHESNSFSSYSSSTLTLDLRLGL